MTDQERLAKLEQAVALIREVEFSYPQGSDERKSLYRWVAAQCSFLGYLGALIGGLRRQIHEPAAFRLGDSVLWRDMLCIVAAVGTSLTGRWRYTLSREGCVIASDVSEHELEQHIV